MIKGLDFSLMLFKINYCRESIQAKSTSVKEPSLIRSN